MPGRWPDRTILRCEAGRAPGEVPGPGPGRRLRETQGCPPVPRPHRRTLLELGCGRGGLLLELVRAGAARATGVDLSPASVDEARKRFERAQLSERVHLTVGDAARVPLEPHDWVILDRVICCYPDVDRLLTNTLRAATHIFAFTLPTSRGWRGIGARLDSWFENVWNTLRGRPCPGYVHDLDLIEQSLAAAGFRLRLSDHRRLWHIAVYERSAGFTGQP